jgi:hypothetical protein
MLAALAAPSGEGECANRAPRRGRRRTGHACDNGPQIQQLAQLRWTARPMRDAAARVLDRAAELCQLAAHMLDFELDVGRPASVRASVRAQASACVCACFCVCQGEFAPYAVR